MRHPVSSTLALLLAAGLTAVPAGAAPSSAEDREQRQAGSDASHAGAGQSAKADAQDRFSGLVVGVRPSRINADGDTRLLGRMLLDDGRLALVNFGDVEQVRSGVSTKRPAIRNGQRIAGTGRLERLRGEPMLVVEQWRLIGHPSATGHPPMLMHSQVFGHHGMAMNPSRPSRPGSMRHPSWVQQPRDGVATDMDVMLTGTVLGVGTDDGDDAGNKPEQRAGQPADVPRQIRVSGPNGLEVTADLGPSDAAHELHLADGDQVVLYGDAGMQDGRPILMAEFAAKLVALPRAEDDTDGQAKPDNPDTKGRGESTSAANENQQTPRSRMTGGAS
jgi:putative component of toxin-antitoxin plasmid stabilization module